MATQQITTVTAPVTENPICIHALAGRAPKSKMCAHNYECATCPFDQMLEDIAQVVPTRTEVSIIAAKAA